MVNLHALVVPAVRLSAHQTYQLWDIPILSDV